MSRCSSSLPFASCQGAENRDQGQDPQPRKENRWTDWLQETEESDLVECLGKAPAHEVHYKVYNQRWSRKNNIPCVVVDCIG